MKTKLITGTKEFFERDLDEATEQGWMVIHFDTAWTEPTTYYNERKLIFSALLTAPTNT